MRNLLVAILVAFIVLLLSGGALLASLPYEGVNLVVVTQTGPFIAGPLIEHSQEWTEMTGGTVEVIEVPYGDLYSKIMTSFVTGVAAFDIIVVSATWLPDFTPHLIPLDDYIANPETDPDWADIMPAFQELVMWGEHKYALPLDGDTHTLFYRRDIFQDAENQANFKEKYGYDLRVPETMDELYDVAEFFTGWDWNGDGAPDYGWAQPMMRGTQSHWWFWNFTAPFSVMPGGPDKYRGVLYFDPETMEPLINQEGFVRGLTLYRDMAKFGPPGMLGWDVSQIRASAPGGNIAMWMEWGAFPGLSQDPEVAHPDMIGNNGSAQRPGSLEVWDRETQAWVTMEEVNRAPVLSFGGWVAGITQTAANPDAAFDFIRFMASPETSIKDVVRGDTGYNPYRFSHVKNLDAWLAAGFGEQDAIDYLAAIEADMVHPNAMSDLRIPGKAEYVDTILDRYVSMVLAGELEPREALDIVYEEWEKITDRLGREQQLASYRTMLGLD
ncbi:MAG TPA: extracellular solute-binding protein [Atribacteraceae bacterium]|nr:extracellular solute-binding protein [Atribacteraceae bacterium]